MRVIVKPGRFAFIRNMRWFAGEEVEVEGNKCPEWAVPAETEAAAEVKAKVLEDKKKGNVRAFAPSSMKDVGAAPNLHK